MPISQETQDLLDIAIQKVVDEGFNIAGFYMSAAELVHFSMPQRSRSNLAKMVETWLDFLQDQDIATEVVGTQRIYQA